MKILRSIALALLVGVASISVAQARDSFSIGINVGGYSHHTYPAVSYHVVPQVIYYNAPVIHYRHHTQYGYYQAPAVVYQGSYYDAPRYYDRAHRKHSSHHYNRHGHRRGHH